MSQMTLAQNYEMYLVPALFLPWSRLLLDMAQPQAEERILDLACGTGIVARQIARRLNGGATISALDLNPKMLAAAQSLALEEKAVIEWHEGSALDMPFPDQSFDLVVCQQGLQFFPDQRRALQEVCRVLAPQGRLIVSINQPLDQNPIYHTLNEIFKRHMGTSALAAPFTFGDETTLQTLLVEAGFQSVAVERMPLPTHFSSADVFVRATVLGSAAVVPAFAQLETARQESLIREVTEEMRDYLAPHTKSDQSLDFSVMATIGQARLEP